MHGMDAATLDELRELRARAYGPSADIDHDPAALQRLHELEARHGAPPAASVGVPGSPAQVGPEPEAPAVASRPAESSRSEEASPSDDATDEPSPAIPVGPTRPRRRPSGRAWALWSLTVLGAGALAAGLTYSMTSAPPVEASSGAPLIDTLDPDPFVDVPDGWFGAGPSSLAFEYYGLTLFETSGGYSGAGDCFSVVGTDQLPAADADTNDWSISGMMYSGCRAGAFPATVQFVIDSSAPPQLRDRFPAGSALQFVFDGDRMGVFLDSGGD